ncbi:unnamed protein product [Merluccius merluccius]
MEPLPPLTTLIQNGDPGQLGGCPALQQQSGADTLEDGIQRDSKSMLAPLEQELVPGDRLEGVLVTTSCILIDFMSYLVAVTTA